MRSFLRAGFTTLVLSWGLIGESTPAHGGLGFSPGGDSSGGYQTLKPGLPPGSAPPVYTNPQPTPVLGPSGTAASINGQPASLTQAPVNGRVVLRRESFQTPLRLERQYVLKNSLLLPMQAYFQKTRRINSTNAPQDDRSTSPANAEVQREDQGLAELLRSDDARSAETYVPAPAPSQQGIWTVQQLADALVTVASLEGNERRKAYEVAHDAAKKIVSGETAPSKTATLILERNGEANIWGVPGDKDSWIGKARGIPNDHWVTVIASQSTPDGTMALVWYRGHKVGEERGREQFVGWAYISVPNANLTPRQSEHAAESFLSPLPGQALLVEPLGVGLELRSLRLEMTAETQAV